MAEKSKGKNRRENKKDRPAKQDDGLESQRGR